MSKLREHARLIWQAAVDAANPRLLVRNALCDPSLPLHLAVQSARRILITGGGKAGLAMAQGVEDALAETLDRLEGWVNVPDFAGPSPLRKIHLHGARPISSNHPTERGVAGTDRMLALHASATADAVGLCLLSGGGSALLPAPVEGITLADKQQITRLLHACGATIQEMNAVRKHLSRVKGGRLADTWMRAGGGPLFGLILSDVVGDPLDVIASGPTSPDPVTFADAMQVLERYRLLAQTPPAVRDYLQRGVRGEVPETAKTLPERVHNLILGNNARSLRAAQRQAEQMGYTVLNLGSFFEGEAQAVAGTLAAVVCSVLAGGPPLAAPFCLLAGGETTVSLGEQPGKGGRNQELAMRAGQILHQRHAGAPWAVLAAGTDGEDGPTDAAGGLLDDETLSQGQRLGLDPAAFLARHDAYHYLEASGGLLRTGLTGTNVMDVSVFLVAKESGALSPV